MIGVEGTKTPVGNSGKAETPQRASVRRLSVAPRKAKCLQRKSTGSFTAEYYSANHNQITPGVRYHCSN
ncbi:hypothetical protein CYJ37_00395 [Bacillus sp. UMB0728]|nr:hypothetical protein CYJ37_00395 [Bacillus sp. UMB0728]